MRRFVLIVVLMVDFPYAEKYEEEGNLKRIVLAIAEYGINGTK